MHCPSCGKELLDDSQSCPSCGTSLRAMSTKHRSRKKSLIITVLVLTLLASSGVLLSRLLARRPNGTTGTNNTTGTSGTTDATALIPYRKGDK